MSKYVGFRLGKVHESHVISEYYCGGCGWPVTDHDSFCPECGGAFRECDASDLGSENAKLRELLLDIAVMLGKNINLSELCEESANLRAENARLRKLLLDVWNDAIRFDGFWDYVMDDGELYNKDELPHYQERMRDLGVEVNV